MSNKLVFKVAFATDDPNEPDNRYFYSMTEAGEFIDNVMWKETIDRLKFLQTAGLDITEDLHQCPTATISIVTMADVPELE